jgi:hypothetical protein
MLCIKIHKEHIVSSNEKLKRKRTKDKMDCILLAHPAHLLLCVDVWLSEIPPGLHELKHLTTTSPSFLTMFFNNTLQLCHPINPSWRPPFHQWVTKWIACLHLVSLIISVSSRRAMLPWHAPLPASPLSYCVSAGAPQATHTSQTAARHVWCKSTQQKSFGHEHHGILYSI